MKTAYKLTILSLMLLAFAVVGFSQNVTVEKPQTTTQNLVRGTIGPLSNNASWSNYSVFNEIPGSALFPITSSSTVFYYGFTAGTEADISNIVLYTTAHFSSTITAATPVTLGGVSNPSINLANTSVCPVPPTATTPCIVRFDPLSLTLSPSSDYYFVVYFASDSNNQAIGGAQSAIGISESSMGAFYTSGDNTHLTVGQSIPNAGRQQPIFLMYVMNN
jgi:hypothetical protein